jgi:uncharacterized protein
MPMIRETIVTTISAAGGTHIAPFGLIENDDSWIIAPFRPSTTLENLLAVPYAVANFTDDVRIFAGCITGRHDWPLTAIANFSVPRLACALAHAELAIDAIEEHLERPRFVCRILRIEQHRVFLGFNRAKAAVVEACILASRLNFLPRDRIEREIAQLAIAVDKTAGAEEQEAFGWVTDMIAAHYARRQPDSAKN